MYGRMINNSPKLKVIQMSMKSRVDDYIMVYSL